MVKCADCGFLAVRNVDSRELEEAEETFREKGTGPLAKQYEGNPHLRHEKQPLCFAMFHSFSADFREAIEKKIPENGRVKQIIQKERQCDKSTEWQQGFTPKEHREKLDRERQLEYEAKRDREDKEWRENQEEKAEERHKEQLKVLQRIHKREMIIVGLCVTIAIAIITVIGAAIDAGWFLPWFGLFN